jgi:hypothetical protein
MLGLLCLGRLNYRYRLKRVKTSWNKGLSCYVPTDLSDAVIGTGIKCALSNMRVIGVNVIVDDASAVVGTALEKSDKKE